MTLAKHHCLSPARIILLVLAVLPATLMAQAQQMETHRVFGRIDLPQMFFGRAVAIEGEWLVVGAYNELAQGASGPWGGACHVFRRSSVGWSRTQVLYSPSPSTGTFGFTVNLDLGAGHLVIGDDDDNSFGPVTGKAFVFELIGGTWVLAQELLSPSPAALEHFGRRADIDGDRVIVGAPGNRDLQSALPNGAIHVYERQGGSWSQVQTIYPDRRLGRTGVSGFFVTIGLGLQLDGDVLVTGLSGGIGQSFAAYHRVNGTWTFMERVLLPPLNYNDEAGDAFALDLPWLAVGRPGSFGSPSVPGRVEIYKVDASGASWNHQQTLFRTQVTGGTGSFDRFGESVSMADGVLAVGAPDARNWANVPAGQAYEFELQSGGTWAPRRWLSATYLEGANPVFGALGERVATSGGVTAVGEPAAMWPNGVNRPGGVNVYEPLIGSSGCGQPGVATLAARGSFLAEAAVIDFQVEGAPALAPVLPIVSRTAGSATLPAVYSGELCLGGSITRLGGALTWADAAGNATISIDARFAPIAVTPGETLHFQAWYRTTGAAPSAFSEARSLTFQ